MASKDTIIKMLPKDRNCITRLGNNDSGNTLGNGKRNSESNDKANAIEVSLRETIVNKLT